MKVTALTLATTLAGTALAGSHKYVFSETLVPACTINTMFLVANNRNIYDIFNNIL